MPPLPSFGPVSENTWSGTLAQLASASGCGTPVVEGTVRTTDFTIEPDNLIIGRTGAHATYERKWQWPTMHNETKTYSMFSLSPWPIMGGTTLDSRGYPYHNGIYNWHGISIQTYECLKKGP